MDAQVSEHFEASVESATKVLREALTSAVPPAEATAAAVGKIFPSAVTPSQDGSGGITLRQLTMEERQVLDQSARSLLAQLVQSAVAGGNAAMTWQPQPAAPPAIPRLLDMMLLTSEQKFMDPGLVFGLLEDLVETITISECEGVFTYLEEHAQALERPRAKQNGKHHMLRTCNQLLRRLSKGRNAVLCGRILIFLARLLPLSDRSGINLQGAYNTANTTPIEDVPEGMVDSNGEPVDAAFYRRFWGLQPVFMNPGPAMRPGPWAGVMNDLTAVLDEFDKQKTIAAASSAPDAEGGELPAAKYLSSPKLMRLQLQDATFRRHFLVQALVFLHACQHPVRMEKAELRSKQVEEAAAMEAALYRHLEGTPERGADFATAVRMVLAGETHWSMWKKEGRGPKKETCMPFERPPYTPPPAPVVPPAAQSAGRKRKPVEPQPGSAPRVRMGSAALDRLWNQAPDNMSSLKVFERKHLPTLREFLDPVVEDMDPENCIEDEFRRKHDKVYQWKALRMISRESLPIFARTAFTGDLEEAARGFFPGEVPAKPTPAAEPSTSGATAQAAPDAKGPGEAAGPIANGSATAAPPSTAAMATLPDGTADAAAAGPDAAPTGDEPASNGVAEALPGDGQVARGGEASESSPSRKKARRDGATDPEAQPMEVDAAKTAVEGVS